MSETKQKEFADFASNGFVFSIEKRERSMNISEYIDGRTRRVASHYSFRRVISIVALSFMPICFIASTTALGQTHSRCECEYDDWVGDCTATIEQQGEWVRIKSNTFQCSRVDWYANGQPHLTVVTDGSETQQLLAFKGDEVKLAIQSCKICTDAMFENSGNKPSSGLDSSSNQTKPVSPFHGVWVEDGRNIFGAKNSSDVVIRVEGNAVSGTWGPATLEGLIHGDKAKIKVYGQGTAKLTLTVIDGSTLRYRWSFGGGKLLRK